jgi:hypothetical protein
MWFFVPCFALVKQIKQKGNENSTNQLSAQARRIIQNDFTAISGNR